MLTLDLLSIKNTRLSLEVLESLQHLDKAKLVLNKASKDWGLNVSDVERTLDKHIDFEIPHSEKLVVDSINKGIPFMISNPASKIAQSIEGLSWSILKKPKMVPQKKGLLNRILTIQGV